MSASVKLDVQCLDHDWPVRGQGYAVDVIDDVSVDVYTVVACWMSCFVGSK